jgi:hypothetical protein
LSGRIAQRDGIEMNTEPMVSTRLPRRNQNTANLSP